MMAVAMSSSSAGSAMQPPVVPPPRTSSLSRGDGGLNASQGSGPGRSRSSRRGAGIHREVKFGNYILGQTLGEGEFGKVKLGWRRPEPGQTVGDGIQVAIKLIRKESVDTKTRMNKIDREISILRRVHHPNIVKLCDVIYTERHIGIILEYASGGELFDYILSHRYLKDHVACKLFAQLISGVSYLHEKGIVHRDLKLENLLLDQNRNIIVTDFGFANTFDVNDILEDEEQLMLSASNDIKRSDLMATSCGSPCYAAPELVVTDGLYAGKKVDVWSCGVILYAMLAGYLPWDDDPANPEGDNINLLYKYIVTTPLTFPEYISAMARDLLRKILIADPSSRYSLNQVKEHNWLWNHTDLFRTPIQEFEAVAKASILQLSSHTMGRSISAREERSHVSYIPTSSSHLVAGGSTRQIPSKTSPHVATLSPLPKRHTVQVEYDRPLENRRQDAITTERDDIDDEEIDNVGIANVRDKVKEAEDSGSLIIPAAPALVRSATTSAAAVIRAALSPVPEGPNAELSSAPSVVSPGNRPASSRLPAPQKPRPTSYNPPSIFPVSVGNVPIPSLKASGDHSMTDTPNSSSRGSQSSRPATDSEHVRTESYLEKTGTIPKSSYQHASGEITKTSSQTEASLLAARDKAIRASSKKPVLLDPLPSLHHIKGHKRASASTSLVSAADKFFGLFSAGQKMSPSQTPPEHPTIIARYSTDSQAAEPLPRSNTVSKRWTSTLLTSGQTVLPKRDRKEKFKSATVSGRVGLRNVTPHNLDDMGSSPVTTTLQAQISSSASREHLSTFDSKKLRSKVGIESEGHRKTSEAASLPVRSATESPKIGKSGRRLGELPPERGSTGAARRVMDFFRRRATSKGVLAG